VPLIFRRTVIHLLIGTVLLCPSACLLEAAGVVACAQEASCDDHDCSCALPADEPAPCPPKEGGNCLCHGAVMEHVTQVPALELQPLWFCGLEDPLQIENSSACGAHDLQPSACDFAVADSGRTIRALIESLLI
jgi:hypothetical protein